MFRRQRSLQCLTLAFAYVIAGRLGLLLAVPPGYATAIFPPAGIAMAAAFIAGRRMLPWIFAGSCLLNLWVGYAVEPPDIGLLITLALLIALASVLQAALGAWSLRKLIGYPMSLDNARDLARFLLLSPLVCVTSASISLGGMRLLGAVEAAQLVSNWFAWWIGDTLGVLLFLPLIMVVAGEPRAFWRSRTRPVALPMLLFFALFVAIFVRTRGWERDQSLAEFQLLSQSFSDNLQSQLHAQEDSLTQLAAFWSGSAQLSRTDFGMLTRHLLERFPAIRAIEWAPRITGADRAEFEATQQRDVPGFAIREHAQAGGMLRAGDRDEFYPVTYVEPLRSNETALGFDLASDPVARAAIRDASATGAVTATEPITLVQEPGESSGILLTLTVPGGPNRSGVLLIVLRMARFIEAVLGPSGQAVEVGFVDRQSKRSLFGSVHGAAGTVHYEQVIGFGGRSYDVSTTPTALYLDQHRSWQSWAVLAIGVLSTSLLGALLMLSTGERHRFARLLAERTRERDRFWQVSEDLLGVSNFDGYFPSVNPAWTKSLGWSEEEIRALHVSELSHPDDAPIALEGRRRLAEGAGTVRMENRFRHKDGSYRWIYWTMTAEDDLIYVIGRDVTADKASALVHRRTEEQLRQLQKMDSVGQLTGGIAHDFNNLLTVILGNLEILERSLDAMSDRATKAIRAAMSGATRAATLTQRLLAFAQRQPLRPRGVDINELVTGMGELIRRTQGEMIEFEFALGEHLPSCFCDANQVETALLNLVINARDAMPLGGRLRIETTSVNFDPPDARVRGIAAGTYVVLAVTDTGVGMSPETTERAFEPFFTTKDTGKGTGLGLSMVYGFVKQSNGHIEIESEPGRGTTLRIFLPALVAREVSDVDGLANQTVAADVRGHRETILVAEDDAGVRGYVVEALRELNYTVLEAADAYGALEMIAQSDVRVDLLLTDVVMPGMNGRELANRVRKFMPGVRVLFMTGYSQDPIVHEGRLDPDIELIEKPFRGERLAARVRVVLDAALDRAGGGAPADVSLAGDDAASSGERVA